MNNEKPTIKISYCIKCRWLLRASWMAQEILSTFEDEIGEVVLSPGLPGQFDIFLDDQQIWSRKNRGGFPEITELKIIIRDRAFPDKNLGHVERH